MHKCKSRTFYSVLKRESTEEGKNGTRVLSLAFDYMQNISLPKVPVQELFYLRQLTVNVFCINDVKQNKSTIYVYHEGNCKKKTPDEVCTFLSDYLKQVPGEITELRIFSDNCAGQNKNQTLSN